MLTHSHEQDFNRVESSIYVNTRQIYDKWTHPPIRQNQPAVFGYTHTVEISGAVKFSNTIAPPLFCVGSLFVMGDLHPHDYIPYNGCRCL
jgi:hypothetical protein